MMKIIYIRIIILSFIQALTYFVIYNVGWYLGSYVTGEPKNDLFWGITAKFAFISFVVISITGTAISEILKKKFKRVEFINILLSFILFLILFINNYNFTPNKTLLLLFSALTGLTSKWFVKGKKFVKTY